MYVCVCVCVYETCIYTYIYSYIYIYSDNVVHVAGAHAKYAHKAHIHKEVFEW